MTDEWLQLRVAVKADPDNLPNPEQIAYALSTLGWTQFDDIEILRMYA